MWNDSIKLPSGYTTTTDKDGFDTSIPDFIDGIPANFKSTTRADETLANQEGYTADLIIEIMACNYGEQKELVDEKNSKGYDIKRSHEVYGKEIIELTCQRR